MHGFRYKFQSYNAESLRLWAEKYPGKSAKLPFVVTSGRTALTRELADYIAPLMVGGMNPTSLAKVLLEMKAAAHARRLITGYGAVRAGVMDPFLVSHRIDWLWLSLLDGVEG